MHFSFANSYILCISLVVTNDEKASLNRKLRYGTTHPIATARFVSETLRLRQNEKHKFNPSEENIFDNYADLISFLTGGVPINSSYLNLIKDIFSIKTQEIVNVYGSHKPSSLSLNECIVLYQVVRHFRPRIMVETGVSDGMSSLFILKALSDNGVGHLYSIDLPDVGMPRLYGKEPGWLIDENIKSNWTLIFGKSSQKLIPLLKELQSVNLFLHDSEHSYKNMKFEFSTALKFLSKGGLMLSDDVSSNNAFLDSVNGVRGGYKGVAILKNSDSDFGTFKTQ